MGKKRRKRRRRRTELPRMDKFSFRGVGKKKKIVRRERVNNILSIRGENGVCRASLAAVELEATP